MSVELGCVVEGHGETEALPIVLRRIALDLNPAVHIEVPGPIRTPKSKLLKEGELERAVELAARNVGGAGGVLVLIDSDDDCPARLGPALLTRARAIRGNMPLGIVLAKFEFESWFLAAAESLAGRRGLPADLKRPNDPEGIRGAKEWLSDRMGNRGYSETLDQPAFAAVFDLAAARTAPSFDKCYREMSGILRELREAG